MHGFQQSSYMSLHSFAFLFKGELETTICELEESNHKLAVIKAERDVAKGASFPVLNQGNRQATNDKVRDKERDLEDMESTLKELLV